jgi:hypothetical protein
LTRAGRPRHPAAVVDLALSSAADAENPDRGDVALSGGELVLLSDATSEGRAALVRQRLELGLSVHRRTWRLDLNQGVDYAGRVFVKGADPTRVRAVLEAEALRDSDVASARASVVAPGPDRALRATVDAVLTDGTTVRAEVGA